MYAHALKARAADRKQGCRYEMTLTKRGDLSKPDERLMTLRCRDMAHARQLAAACDAKPHNF